MSEITWKETKSGFKFWKLAILLVSVKSLISLFNSLFASLSGAEWGNFTTSQQFVAAGSAFVAMLTVIDAFLNQTMSELRKKKDENTQAFLKSDVKNP